VKALVKTASGPGGIELLDLPPPVAGPGQVLMAVRAGALCGTDVHIAHGTVAVRPPLVLGHELAGVVAALGPGVTGIRIGERITTETDASVCGACAHCRVGDQHLCPQRTAIGTTSPGGLAELVAVPAAGVHRLPDHVDFATGALTEPLAVAVRAVVERADVGPADDVVVIGPGTIGLLVAQVARARGADVTVAGLARHEARFRLAHDLGIQRTVALDGPGAPDVDTLGRDGLGAGTVFECSGAPDAVDAGLRLLRKGGRLVAVAFTGGRPVSLDLDTVVSRELALIASRGKRPSSFRAAIELLASGRVTPGPLVTHRFGLDRWAEAFETAGRSGTKVVLEIDGA
jgi:L-iditol 2-dehydrogenase